MVLAFGLPCASWKVPVWFSTSFNVAGFVYGELSLKHRLRFVLNEKMEHLTTHLHEPFSNIYLHPAQKVCADSPTISSPLGENTMAGSCLYMQ
jgi:hypothetical protein